MCGISVIIRRDDKPINHGDITLMNAQISHRGPDHEGVFFKSNIGMGHRRLSIIDLKEESHQPFKREHYTMVYNGALFNYVELKRELQNLGYQFYTQSDTEVVLVAYIAWGETCLEKFNGMWAIVIYDEKKDNIFISRDRYGIKPLYIYQDEKTTVISSEVKQILALKPDLKIINNNIFFEFLATGKACHTYETFYQDIKPFPAACFMTIDNHTGQQATKRYYKIGHTEPIGLAYEKAKEFIYDLLNDAVKLRLRSDVEIGASLSGGLDSSILVSLVTGVHAPIKTFSAIFDESQISEKQYVESLKDYHHLKNFTLTTNYNQIKAELSNVVKLIDQPITSTSVIVQNLLYKLQSDHGIKVSLSGQGADEVLAGYDGFYRPYLQEIKAMNFIQRGLNLTSLVMHHPKMIKKYRNYRSSNPILKHEYTASKISNSNSIKAKSISYLEGMGLPLLLHYEDRNSMAYGIESRQPYLDHRVVEASLALPFDYKIDSQWTKKILRDAFRKNLPPIIANRKDKLSYTTPQNRWYREHSDEISTEISNHRLGNLLHPSLLKSQMFNSKKLDDGLIIRLLSSMVWLDENEISL